MEDVQVGLKAAREKLAAFEEASEGTHLLQRLRRVSPAHPLLLGRTLSILGACAALVATVGVLAVPIVSRELAGSVSRLQEGLGFPLPVALGVFTLCAGALAMAVHQLALGSARSAPMLPEEAKQHQRLVADVKQLEARMAYEGTPAPAVRITRPQA